MIELPNARTMLVIDGAGGAFSAFFLGVVLTQYHSFIGIQRETLLTLAAIACAFAAYSLTSYAFGKEHKRLLRIVAVANLAYCCLTLGVMYYFSETLRVVGAVYFFVEIAVISALAAVELRVSSS